MTSTANIFIPDISGYTEFLSNTELEHSSHIMNELLQVLVESNTTDLTLSEIEGDALLFYRTGEPIPLDRLTEQATEMFRNFHIRLKIIERDSICQCGACQTASNLTLKFVVHYGTIKEIEISRFVKASGIDMIIAHRLLKNSLDLDEYLLATRNYVDAIGEIPSTNTLTWNQSSEKYPTVGEIAFHYAPIGSLKESLPPLPEPERATVDFDERSVGIEINAPMDSVYATLIDFDGRAKWIQGLQRGRGEEAIDRLNVKHFCYFDDLTIEVVPFDFVVEDDCIRYMEEFTVSEHGLHGINEYRMEKVGDNRTRIGAKVGSRKGESLPGDAIKTLLDQLTRTIEQLKEFCEKKETGVESRL